MAILKEYRCIGHGPFEGYKAVCPHGCSVVIREFRTAPGLKSVKTKRSDNALERMAQRYGLTDMSASKTGSVAGDRMAKQQGFGQIGGQDYTPKWGELPKGGTYEVGKGVVARDGSEGGVEAAVKQLSRGQAEPVPDGAPALPVMPRGKPRPNVVGRDSVTANEFSDAVRVAT